MHTLRTYVARTANTTIIRSKETNVLSYATYMMRMNVYILVRGIWVHAKSFPSSNRSAKRYRRHLPVGAGCTKYYSRQELTAHSREQRQHHGEMPEYLHFFACWQADLVEISAGWMGVARSVGRVRSGETQKQRVEQNGFILCMCVHFDWSSFVLPMRCVIRYAMTYHVARKKTTRVQSVVTTHAYDPVTLGSSV